MTQWALIAAKRKAAMGYAVRNERIEVLASVALQAARLLPLFSSVTTTSAFSLLVREIAANAHPRCIAIWCNDC
jgi:hypothetical protein